MNYLIANDCSLQEYNTLRLKAKAHTIVYPLNSQGVQDIYKMYYPNKKLIILGNGSNILLSKDYYNENYIFISFKLFDHIEVKSHRLIAEAGVTLSRLSWFAVENRIQGYEFLEDVPGSIGGAIIMNAGTYEDTIGQLVKEITYYNIERNKIETEIAEPQDFGKRQSKWSDENNIILSVSLCASSARRVEDYEKLIKELLEIKKKRYLKQPRNYPNAGSVFKRPSLNGKDYYVWKLFEDVGLRGYRKNGAMISDKHPGFIVNVNNAEAKDVLDLIDLAIKKVKDKFGITLELEWKII